MAKKEARTRKLTSPKLAQQKETVLPQPTPIIITGGSLTIESQGVDFSQFTPDGRRKLKHPRNARIISVDIRDGDDPNGAVRISYVPPSNGKCVITVNY
jgi:hypothetical protein